MGGDQIHSMITHGQPILPTVISVDLPEPAAVIDITELDERDVGMSHWHRIHAHAYA